MTSPVKLLVKSTRRLGPLWIAALGLGAAAALLIVATTTMAWATYKSAATGTVRFGGGELGRATLWLASTEIVLAVCLWFRPAAIIGLVAVAVGTGSLVVAAALALNSIYRANTVYRYAPVPSQSAYGLGSGLGLLASLGLVVIGAAVTGQLVSRHGGSETRQGVAPPVA